MANNLTFKIGDKAVYPAHGVGKIESIETKEISGSKISFYVMKILDSDMTIMIPTKNIVSVGLREIIKKNKLPKVFKILNDKTISIDIQTWNRRYREYMKKIKTGSVYEIAEVLRDLLVLKQEKVLSFGERKMLETAKSLLKKEISISKNVAEKEVETELKGIFKTYN